MTEERCLLIYDNVDDTQFLPRFWPESESVSALVTTQRAEIRVHTMESIKVGVMDKTEGAELLLRLSGHKNVAYSTNEEAKKFSESLGGLPLAIAHYAGYMTRSNISLDEFHHTFRDHFQDSQIWLVSPIYMPVTDAKSEYGIITATISPKTGRGALFWQEYVATSILHTLNAVLTTCFTQL